jgi:hypothetical protein
MGSSKSQSDTTERYTVPFANAIYTTVEQFCRAALYFSYREKFAHQALIFASSKPLGIDNTAGAFPSYSVSFCSV